LVTGCGDGSIFGYHINKETKEHKLLYECSGHDDSVNALAINSLSTQLASAGNDMMIHLYNVYSEEGADDVESIKGHKRRKVLSIPKKTPISSLEGHSDKITSICYSKTDGQLLYSGGYDHSVRCWDLEKKDNIITMNCEKVTLSLDHCSSGLLASGHVDNIIRLWDPRAQEGKLVKMQLKSHTNWVSSVAWSPSNKFVLASASYDGTIKLWDIRSTSAFCTLEQKESNAKLLTMDWSESMIVAGGEGKTLDIHQYSV
jgi:ribosome biogenesis protein YTM1